MNDNIKYFVDSKTILILSSNLSEKRGFVDLMMELAAKNREFVTSMRSVEDLTRIFLKKGASPRTFLSVIERIFSDYIRPDADDFDLALQIVEMNDLSFRTALDAAVCMNRRLVLFSDDARFDHVSGLIRYPFPAPKI